MRPFNGPCPYCGERIIFGMHDTAWLSGIAAGLSTAVLLSLLFR
jgi:hypothetical protein